MFTIVYVRKIAVLFFVAMMLNVKPSSIRRSFFSITPIGIVTFLISVNLFELINTFLYKVFLIEIIYFPSLDLMQSIM